jgi:monovalent cation/hydrogen antiporter
MSFSGRRRDSRDSGAARRFPHWLPKHAQPSRFVLVVIRSVGEIAATACHLKGAAYGNRDHRAPPLRLRFSVRSVCLLETALPPTPRWLIPSVARADPSPPWQWLFALAFIGVRGTASLAAALAIPLTTESGALFPDRDRILFLTFSIILVTLVGQGLMLPAVIRALGLANAGRRERHADRVEEFATGRQAIEAAMQRLDELVTERKLTEDYVRPLRTRHRDRLEAVEHCSDGDEGHQRLIELHDEIEFTLIETERQQINNLYRGGKLKDEARRQIELELDLREAQLTNVRSEE